MPATRKNQAGTTTAPSAPGSPGDGNRHLGHGRRLRSGTAPHASPDVGTQAREAVVSFLRDASDATAERGGVRAGVPATGTEDRPVADGSATWRATAISVATLDRIEAAAAKVEADIAVAVRAYADLQAGAGAAAEAAVHAAQSAMVSAGVAAAAERQVKISVRQVRQYVVITTVLLAVVILVLAFATSPVI
jgi:hypothetical protein